MSQQVAPLLMVSSRLQGDQHHLRGHCCRYLARVHLRCAVVHNPAPSAVAHPHVSYAIEHYQLLKAMRGPMCRSHLRMCMQ